ncbi:MAG: ROK family protein [Lachnospirales bacterium]
MKKTFSGINLEDVQEINRSTVLNILRRKNVTSRIEIAKTTGLKQSTITNIVKEFISTNIVKEVGMIEGVKGRRSIGITLNSDNYKVIAVKITRKYYEVALYDIIGNCFDYYKDNIDSLDSPSSVIMNILNKIESIQKNNSDIIGVGVAVPGPFIKDTGRIALISGTNGWNQIDICEIFQRNLSVPVFFEHDANAAAIAEWWFGNFNIEKGTMITVLGGQGIGCGIVIDGMIYNGASGIAGEIGHVSIDYNGPQCECGNKGCLELYCSSLRLIDNIEHKLPNYPESYLSNIDVTFESISKAVNIGDELAIICVKEVSKFLSYGIVTLINTYNPHIIVINDELNCGGHILLSRIKEDVKKRVVDDVYENLIIEFSSLKDDSKLLGAVTLVTNEIFSKPSRVLKTKK